MRKFKLPFKKKTVPVPVKSEDEKKQEGFELMLERMKKRGVRV